MLNNNIFKYLSLIYSIICYSNNCYSSNEINKNGEINNNIIINSNANLDDNFITYDGNSAPNPINNPINNVTQNNEQYNNDIKLLIEQNNELKKQFEILSKNFNCLQLKYNMEVEAKIHRNKLKELYQFRNDIENKIPDMDFCGRNNYNNISYKFTRDVNSLLDFFKPDFIVNKKDDVVKELKNDKNEAIPKKYTKSYNICNIILYKQACFLQEIKEKTIKMYNFIRYVQSILNHLPDYDPNNIEIIKEIKLLINNDCKLIVSELLAYKDFQRDLKIEENLSKIDEYIGMANEQINELKNKVNWDYYYEMQEVIYNGLNKLSQKYNNLLSNHEFFVKLQDEIKYDEKLKQFMNRKNPNNKNFAKSNKHPLYG